MENASKALIMAGGVLIALLIVSSLVIAWNKISDYNRSEERIDSVEKVVKFNKEFESYNKNLVRGYELISLTNLAEDINKRYSEDDGFKKIEIYIKLLKNTILVDNVGDEKAQKKLTSEYIDINDFMSNYYLKAIGSGDENFSKIYKEAYFECEKTVYDGDEEKDKKGSARIQKMYFVQIDKKSNTKE